MVGLRLVDPGNIVHATDTNGLLVITQIDPISVIFTLAEDQLPPVLQKLHAGQKLPVQAWDRENKNKIADGTLETIDNQIDPTTGTLRLRANFANPNFQLFPSQFVNTRLLVDTHRSVTLVRERRHPAQRNDHLCLAGESGFDGQHSARSRSARWKAKRRRLFPVSNPKDEVVMVGVDKLQDGGRVNAQVSGEAPAKSTSG